MTESRLLVTPHFGWAEVLRSRTATARHIDNSLPAALIPNVKRVAALMEEIRALLGGPITVTSWYRCPILNGAIGGSATSAHMLGLAVDWEPTMLPLDAAFEMVVASGLVFDQLIHEQTRDGARWIHVGLSEGLARHQVLRAHGAVLGGRMNYRRMAAG